MAASLAKIAYGAKLEVETAPGSAVFTEILEIKSVNKPDASIDDVDVTHMSSPGLAKEFLAGMTDTYAIKEHRRLFDHTPDLG